MMVCWKSICACLTCFTNILSGNENKTNVFSSWAGWGNEMKMKFNFFWKMIPIKNIIVISIIWLAWAITASFYSTHANVSHVPTPPPPPPTPGVLGRWCGGPKHFRSNNARRMFKLTQMLTFEHIHENYLYWRYLEISWYILAEEERQ